MVEKRIGGGFRKQGRRWGGKIGQRDWIDGLDSKTDFTIVDDIIEPATIGQQI